MQVEDTLASSASLLDDIRQRKEASSSNETKVRVSVRLCCLSLFVCVCMSVSVIMCLSVVSVHKPHRPADATHALAHHHTQVQGRKYEK